jgi:hypothetical protein
VIEIPGGLYDSTRRPRRLRVVSYGNWFLAAPGILQQVGFGELALEDLEAVYRDLGGKVFVAHPEPHPMENYLSSGPAVGRRRTFGMRRQKFYGEAGAPLPSLGAVARGAQVAVLPEVGPVWVDGVRLFKPGEIAPLPWTDPLVELRVVRPRELQKAMLAVIGPNGPKRVTPPEGPVA